MAGIDALRHEAQPNNRLGGEIQCNARPDDENNYPNDAVPQPVGPMNIEFCQDDPGSGNERHDDHHINDQKNKLQQSGILTEVKAKKAGHASPAIRTVNRAISRRARSVTGLAGGAGVNSPRVGGRALNLGLTHAAWLVGTAENKKTCFTVANALFL